MKTRLYLALLVVALFSSCGHRSGEDIYKAMFGGQLPKCVDVIHRQDQTVPVLDEGIFLHFKTCPEELRRLVAMQPYKCTKEGARVNQVFVQKPEWFQLQKLGDSLLYFTNVEQAPKEVQEFFVSVDSMEVYYMNVLL